MSYQYPSSYYHLCFVLHNMECMKLPKFWLYVVHCLYGVLLLENESHQTALAMVEEEDQFADCLELVSVFYYLML